MRRRALGLAVLLLVACQPATTPSSDGVPIVLVTIDTLRADALGVYGAHPSPSPRLDRLATKSLVFENAVTPLPETRPAHFSLFTSQYPRQHGVLSNTFSLPTDVATLTETLRQAGYTTAGFTGCALLGEGTGAARGFDTFEGPEDAPQRPADAVVPQALTWLAQTESPFFLWLHLFDPHMPYEPPAHHEGTAAAAPDVRRQWPTFAWPALLKTADRNGGDLPAPVVVRAKELYAGEVAHVDRWLERLLDAVGRVVDLDHVILVIAADHGECFGNGTYFDHSNCLYDGATRVPLMVRYPAHLTAGRYEEPVSLIDIAPTVLALAGLPSPPSFRGRNVLAEQDSQPVFLQHPLYRQFDIVERGKVLDRLRTVGGQATQPIRAAHELVGARDGTWKYLISADGEELFHLPNDPHETRNLAADQPAIAARYRRLVRRWRQEHPLRLLDPGQIDPALLDNLRALGYI